MHSLEVLDKMNREAVKREIVDALSLAVDSNNKITLREASRIATLIYNYLDRGNRLEINSYMYAQDGYVYIHNHRYTINTIPKEYLSILLKYLLKIYNSRR